MDHLFDEWYTAQGGAHDDYCSLHRRESHMAFRAGQRSVGQAIAERNAVIWTINTSLVLDFEKSRDARDILSMFEAEVIT